MRASPTARVNVTLGPKEDRNFVTGLHTVSDIHCITCGNVLGWKYVSDGAGLVGPVGWVQVASCDPSWESPPTCLQEVAFEESQKYKEGKYIVEKQRVMKVWRWSRLLTWAHSCVCWGRGRSS